MPLESLTAVIILSILVEFVTNVIKRIIPLIKLHNMSAVVAAIVGIILCMATSVGILNSLDIGIRFPWIDHTITGLLVSRGSNVVHDMSEVFRKNMG